MSVLEKFKNVSTFVFDVDGVLTDGKLLLMEEGHFLRSMNIKDGFALQLAIKKNYQIFIISGGNSSAVKSRLQRLGIKEVHLAVHNKWETLQQLVDKYGSAPENILYMGDDLPDLEVMKNCGLACAPADACQEIKSIAHYVSHLPGGNGCVRDVIEKVLKLNQHWSPE